MCRAQVPALKRHLAATLKSAEDFLAEADVQQQQQTIENGRPATPSPQEQRRRQARVESHPVDTVSALLPCCPAALLPCCPALRPPALLGDDRLQALLESSWEVAGCQTCPHNRCSTGGRSVHRAVIPGMV